MQMYKNFVGKIKVNVGFILMAILCLYATSSCYKQQPTTLEVGVQFSNGEFVKNARVRLMAEPTSNTGQMTIVNDSTDTNSSGLALFNLDNYYKPGQAGVFVLKVNAFYYGLNGSEVIQIEEEKRNRVVVTIN